MFPGNETIQGALGKGLANLPWEKASLCALGMGLANVPVNGTIQCTL